MKTNHFLRSYHNGAAVAAQWTAIPRHNRNLAKTQHFGLNFKTMKVGQQDLPLRLGTDMSLQKYRAVDQGFERLSQSITALNAYSRPYVVRKRFEEKCSMEKWSDKVTDHAQLRDKDCPICYRDYQLESEVSSKDDLALYATPVKMPCNHIICAPCQKGIAESGTASNELCPICRASMPPGNPHTHHEAELKSSLAKNRSTSRSPKEAAEGNLQILDRYLSRLPTSVRDTTSTPTAIDPNNLDCWSWNIVATSILNVATSPVTIRFVEETDGNPSASDIDNRAQTALYCLHLAVERLRAFLKGDQHGYRTACTSELIARAHFENVVFMKALERWVEDYADMLRDEEEIEELDRSFQRW